MRVVDLSAQRNYRIWRAEFDHHVLFEDRCRRQWGWKNWRTCVEIHHAFLSSVSV